jgi:diaminopimelate epimerase
MKFTKMHGIGNDYVYVDGHPPEGHTVNDPAALAVTIADRHFGVGGDGLIMILPPAPGIDAHVRMRMFNADGSEAEMCGNGIRCVAKYAHDHGLTDAKPMRVQTGNGVLTIDYTTDDAGKLQTATVDMGPPILTPADVPVDVSKLNPTHEPHTFQVAMPETGYAGHALLPATMVSMGNPHAVLFVDDDQPLERPALGKVLENHPAFPNRMNVHFVKINAPDDVTVYHWERGSGATLACGTGACAVAVAGVLTGKTDRTLTAHLPGGDLQLEWREADSHVYMTGPATEVFTGEWPG